MRPVCRADNTAFLDVLNVKVRMEALHSSPPLTFRDLLWEISDDKYVIKMKYCADKNR